LLALYPLAVSIVTRALAAEVARTNRRLAKIGRTDELTGLANRRQGFAVADAELARHRRSGRPALLVLLDIDHFKRINDRYGHPVGDDVLRRVASVLTECTRASDTQVRCGGDEFMLVLPEADLESIDEMSQRMRVQLAASVAEIDPHLRCTLSMGVARAHSEMVDVEDWIQQADAALYRAKAAGRDCVIAAPALTGTA
jgi:diguanylate cyclase